MSFGWFECFLFFMVTRARNKLRSTPLIFLLTSVKPNTQSVCELGCTLLNPAQILLDHFLTQGSFLKTCSQIGNLLLKLGVLFGSMKKLTLERTTCFTRRG
jgi:arginine exporter protein ArgO